MKLSRRTTTAAALAVLALGGTLAATTPASAATTAAYNGACGPGYRVTASTPIKSSPSTTIGTTYVTYNVGNQGFCAVTVRNNPGTRMFMEVTLDTWPTGGNAARDYESFTTYAGPMYKDAPKAA